jgi:hypothetical protein
VCPGPSCSEDSLQASFGSALTTGGAALAVSAPFEDSNASGIDGDQHDHGHPFAGAVYVYQFPP